MCNIIPLSNLSIGTTGVLKEITCDKIKRRLLDLGFIPNTLVTPIFRGIFNDPTAYLIRNIVIALRKSDAEHILIYVK